jgi:hypothetical protein
LGAAPIAPSAAPTAAPAPAAASAEPEPSGEAFDTFIGAPAAIAPEPNGAAQRDGAHGTGATSIGTQATGPVDRPEVVLLAGLLLAAGLGLFALRWVARRS